MPIRPTGATAHLYNAAVSFNVNFLAGVRFEWYGGRGGEIGTVQGTYMELVKTKDLRWLANFPFTTDADRHSLAIAPRTMRAHHVSDAAIKRQVVEWLNGGMTVAGYLSALEDLSSINTLTCPDIIFPEKVAAVWVQWLSGWMKASSAFNSKITAAPCLVTLVAAERLVANMSSALANFRPGFGLTDADGIAHAICPREASLPTLSVFNRALMMLNIDCGNVALESFWVSARYSNTIAAIPPSGPVPHHLVLGGFRGTAAGQIYSSERRAPGGMLATINPGAGIIVPNANQINHIRTAIKIRNGVVTVGAMGVSYMILVFLLIPLFRTMLDIFHA